MFPIRRAALRLLSSSSTPFATRSRAISSSTLSSLRVSKQIPSLQFQRRWATGEAEASKEDAPISKLQPTAGEEVENAISEDNAEQVVSEEPLTQETSSSTAPPMAETANATEATEETISASENPRETDRILSEGSSASRFAIPRSERREVGIASLDPPTPKPTLYVGNLFFDVTEDDLTKEMANFGEVVKIRLIRDARGLSKGFGYVTFASTEMAARALSTLNQQMFEGRRLSIQFATSDAPTGPKLDRGGDKPTNPPSKTLFIGNMSWEMTDRDLNNLFRGIRNVIDVRVAIDRRTGQPRGFAHADFVDIKSAMEGMKALQGKETYGRRLRLDYSYGSSAAPRNQARDEGRGRRDDRQQPE